MCRFKKHKIKTFPKVALTGWILIFLGAIFVSYLNSLNPNVYASPLSDTAVAKPIPIVIATATPTPFPQDIKDYIRIIFGKNWKTAYAIARAESGLRIKANLVWRAENSRGIFQINIMSSTAKVHYDRIPGITLEEKIKWLENPYNNTLMAYWIYQTSGNFNAWTAYTNKNYLAFLEK